MLYWSLFLSFVKVGFLGFGGGMAIISLIQNEVLSHGWMTETEFVDIVAVSQVTPGPVGMNCATYVGYTATGSVWGSLLTSFAIVLPSLLIMLTICVLYDRISSKWNSNKVYQAVMRVIRIGVVLLIANAAYRLMTPSTFIDVRSWVIFGVALACMLLPNVLTWCKQKELAESKVVAVVSNPIFLMLTAGGAGYLLYI